MTSLLRLTPPPPDSPIVPCPPAFRPEARRAIQLGCDGVRNQLIAIIRAAQEVDDWGLCLELALIQHRVERVSVALRAGSSS